MTEPDLVRIATVAAGECVRQRVGFRRLTYLLGAYDYALFTAATARPRKPLRGDALHLAGMIEPTKAAQYRTTPVTFQNGGTAAHHSQIERTMFRMFNLLDADTDPDEFTKAFLDVHPFADGNGRTAWVLWNWLRGTLHYPDPLPDFYGGLTPPPGSKTFVYRIPEEQS